MKSADPLDAFDRTIGEVIGRHVPTTVLRRDLKTSNDLIRRAYDDQQTAYCVFCRARNADHWGRLVLAHAEAQRVYCAARESHNKPTRNNPKHSTLLHKWWETLKGSIFGVKSSIPALMGHGVGLVWLLLRKHHSGALRLTIEQLDMKSSYGSKKCALNYLT